MPLLLALSLAGLAHALTHGANGAFGLNLLVWVATLLVSLLALLRQQRRSVTPEGAALLGCALALTLLFVLRDAPPGLKFLNALALLLALVLGAAHLRFPGLSQTSVLGLLGTLVTGGLRFMLGPISLLERFPWQRYRPQRSAGGWLTGLLLAVPVLLVFGTLLVSADASFAQFVRGIFQWSPDGLTSHLFALLGWSIVAGGLVYPASMALRPSYFPVASGAARLGLVEVGVPLAALAGLFVLFLLLQLPYLLAGTLPAGLTFAEYIRRGFGELMTVALLTLGLLLGTHALTRADVRLGRPYRLLNLLVLLPLLLVVLSAANRWRLYHLAYGLSETRLLGAAFLVWVTACLGWLAILLWRGDLRRFAFPALLLGLGTLWATTMLNPAALIARTNIYRQQAGVTNDLRRTPQRAEVWTLLDLGADAVPALVQHLDILTHPCGPDGNCAQPGERQNVINRLHDLYDPPRDPRAWNASYARAQALVRRLPPATPHGRDSSD